MGILPGSLWALLKKNALLKRSMIGSSIAEVLVPIILFWIASGLGVIFSGAGWDRPSDADPWTSVHEYSPIEDIRFLNINNYDFAFTPKAADTVLGRTVTDILLKNGFKNKLYDFDNFAAAQKFISDKRDEYIIVLDFPKKSPKTFTDMTDAEINALTSAPKWDYTIHPSSFQFQTNNKVFQLYETSSIQPKTNVPLTITQNIVNQAILRLNGLYNGSTDLKTDGKIEVQHKFLPHRSYRDETLQRILLPIFVTMASTGFMPCAFAIVAIVVQEKETFLKQTLIMMGASKYSLYLSWYIFQYVFMLPTIVIVSCIFNYSSTPHFPLFLTFIAYSLYYLACISFFLFLSAFFSKVKTAQTTAGLIYVVTSALGAAAGFIPPLLTTILSCLSIQSLFGSLNALCLELNRLIGTEGGSFWERIHETPTDGFSFLAILAIFVAQIFVFFLLTVYVDNIMPGEYNNPLPFYYPFSPTYWSGFATKDKHIDFYKHSQKGQNNDSGSSLFCRRENAYTPLIPDSAGSSSSSAINPFIQPLSAGEEKQVAVRIRGLVKTFGGADGTPFNAVDNMNVDLMRDQIFSLLGHNGSGKSTTINMLTGLYGSTAGSIELYDRHGIPIDVNDSKGKIGVCPQYNSLYPSLTVNQHMRLFSSIKQQAMGVQIPDAELEMEISSLLRTLKLGPEGDNKQDSPTSTLSGGQKRKVCLALALLHKPSILVLDEPSSGTDVGIQRQIWSLLEKLKKDTAILLSSHHLEEAEIGDRIGIMVKGQMMCCGSSMFLKKSFGVGYQLQLEKVKKPGVFDRITAIDNSVNLDSKLKTFGGARGAEITTLSGQKLITILCPGYQPPNLTPLSPSHAPTFSLTDAQKSLTTALALHNDNQSSLTFSISYKDGDVIPDLMEFLENSLEQLEISDVSLSLTSLEDVFIMANDGSISARIEVLENPQGHGNDSELLFTQNQNVDASVNENLFLTTSTSSPILETPSTPVNSDAGHLAFNTAIWDEEKVKLSWFVLFFIQFRALFWKRVLLQIRDIRSLVRTFLLPVFLAILVVIASYAMSKYPAKNPSYRNFPATTPIQYSQFTPPATVDPADVVYWDNGNKFAKAFSTYGKTMATAEPEWNQFLRRGPRTGYTMDRFAFGEYQLDINDELDPKNPRYVSPAIFTANFDSANYALSGILFTNSTSYWADALFTTRLYETIASTAFPRAESLLSKFGIVLDLNMTIHTLVNNDLTMATRVLVVVAIAISCLIYPTTLIYGLVKERSERVVHLHRISGVSQLAYWLSYGLFDYLIYWIMCGLMVGSFAIFKLPLPPAKILYLALAVYGLITIIFVYALSLLFKAPASAQTVLSIVLILGPLTLLSLIAIICNRRSLNPLKYFWLALVIPSTGIVWPLFESLLKGGDAARIGDLLSILQKWSYFVPFYLAAFWAISGVINKHWLEELFSKKINIKQRNPADIDPDVLRQEDLIKSGQASDPNQYPLVSHGLRKVFGPQTAVNNLYFTLEKQVCFGLLGANGAGKSTSLSMLTSEFISSQSVESAEDPVVQHTAYIGGYDIIKNNEDCWKELGFCPQFDALNLSLTARETLELYCRLRGVVENSKLFVDDLLNALGLEYAADRRISGYSLGMRRRLSIGVALVGNPGVVLIDEGTTGVDPISRANIRLLLQQTCKNRALLITSHNLEEIEALADNIGIMSRGEMKTMGSKNVLKRKLTNHFQLHLQVVSGHELETSVRVLSALTGIPISQELQEHCTRVTSNNMLAEAAADDEKHAQLSQSQSQMRIIPMSSEDFVMSSAYQFFVNQCRTMAGSGCYVTECRHTTVIMNVPKDLYTLSTLFKKVKEIQFQNPKIETYSCAQVPLDQVFLEIVRRDEAELAGLSGGAVPASVHQAGSYLSQSGSTFQSGAPIPQYQHQPQFQFQQPPQQQYNQQQQYGQYQQYQQEQYQQEQSQSQGYQSPPYQGDQPY